MLSLSLLVRARLRAPAATRSFSLAARALRSNAAALSAQSARLEGVRSRAFSTLDGPKDEEQDEQELEQDAQAQPLNGELSPLERLMQHSQQFRLETGDDEDDEDGAGQDGQEDGDNDDDGEDGPFSADWQEDKKERRPAGSFKRDAFRRRGSGERHSKVGRMAVNHLLEKDMDELNYEAELESVWDEDEIRQRKFHQALRRELDRDRVCTNCGERGHRARNCLVPRICSNCGNLGHTAGQCRYRKVPDSVEEFLMQEEHHQERRKQSWKLRKKAAKAVKNPHMPRPAEVPTSDFNKRNESLRKELDAELDAYADMLEEMAEKRKKKQQQKDVESASSTTPSES
ncbi:unnamed protein product [Phytophthora lilii]|uniref:Unnamed protein product n=1 Tax=Phytophthora lilii TaxID=2077276 RepID=A0A9W6WXW1_9STRA|nr:unnamed protein product [Phytophthora lilii]